MKLFLIICFLIFSGCSVKTCPPDSRRSYVYGDRVRVHSGFYKGQRGIIIEGSRRYTLRGCITPYFKLRLTDGREVEIDQYSLFVER
jgi:hypothetical protein